MSDTNSPQQDAEIIPIQGRMTAAQYEAERDRLLDLYGDSSKAAGVKREQALALLFARSGWTQQELADKERIFTGKKISAQHIARQLRFGRFLNFSPIGESLASLPSNFNEGRFREFWERSDKDEKEELRFRQIAKMLKEDAIVSAPRRPGIGKELRNRFADGKWHPLNRIAKSLGADEGHVTDTLEGIRKNQSYECTAEEKTVGTEIHWRIFKLDKAISSDEIAEKLGPIVKKLEIEGKKTPVLMSPVTIAGLAADLRKLLYAWTE